MTSNENTQTCTGEYCCACDDCIKMQAQEMADECAAEARNEAALYGLDRGYDDCPDWAI